MKRALVPAVIMVALGGIFIYQLTSTGGVLCEVCVSFEGARKCAKARGETRRKAEHTAQDSACSLIAHGVSDAFACPRTPPDSVQCE